MMRGDYRKIVTPGLGKRASMAFALLLLACCNDDYDAQWFEGTFVGALISNVGQIAEQRRRMQSAGWTRRSGSRVRASEK